ncbi:MAG TPA: hypothetical protein VGQ76_28395 [Thermoanaerobaculia bacterium]|jgi:hypothetical protein|nr:hypothetical protein [Thermoanaerobaculia bacterium]
MHLFLALLLAATSFPSNSRTSWMRPDAFRLTIGMSRADALSALEKWAPKRGKDAQEIVVDYSDDKALTLVFRKDRLISVRFELFVFLPEIRMAFDEEKSRLADTLGKPRKSTKSILIYDNTLPNVMVVAADDPKSQQGKQGIGILAVRYFDPR